jgi:hypothetical protein
MLAVTAYEAGRVAGQMAVLGLVVAIVARVLRPWLRTRFPKPARIVLGLLAAAAIFVFSLQGVRADDPAEVRAEMLAGCESTGGTASWCGCVIDELLARNGTQPEDLARLEGDIRAVEQDGAPLPPYYQQAGEACARVA